MAKLAPGIRLLRSLARAGKSQQSMLAKFLTAAAPLPSKSRRKSPPNVQLRRSHHSKFASVRGSILIRRLAGGWQPSFRSQVDSQSPPATE